MRSAKKGRLLQAGAVALCAEYGSPGQLFRHVCQGVAKEAGLLHGKRAAAIHLCR